MCRALLCLLMVCISRPVLAGHPGCLLDWEDISGPPGSGSPSALVSSAGSLYAGGRDTGVFRLDALTQTWRAHGLSEHSVRELSANGDTLYAVVGDYQSPELWQAVAGAEWARLTPLSDALTVLIAFESRLYAVAHAGLVEVDPRQGIFTYLPVSVAAPDIHHITPIGFVERRLALGTASGHVFTLDPEKPNEPAVGLWRHGPPGLSSIGADGAKEYTVVATERGMFSQGEGDSEEWSEFGGALPNARITDWVLSRRERIYVATADAGVHIRVGSGWEARNEGLANLHVSALAASRPTKGESTIYAVAGGQVAALAPNSEAWLPMRGGYEDSTASSVATDGDTVYAGASNGCVLRWDRSDMAPEWVALPGIVPGGEIRDLAVTSRVLCAATAEGAFVYSAASESWCRVPTVIKRCSTVATDGTETYLVAHSGAVFRSRGRMADWEHVLPDSNFGSPAAMLVHDSALYVATYYGVLRLCENASSWERLSPSGKSGDGIIRAGAQAGSTRFETRWAFHDLAIVDEMIYGATQTGTVRARLP